MTSQNRNELLSPCVTSSLFIPRKYKMSPTQIHFQFLKLTWHRSFRNCTRFLRNNNTTSTFADFYYKMIHFYAFWLECTPSRRLWRILGEKSLLLMKAYLFSVGTDKAYELSRPCKGLRIPEYRKFSLVESGILGFGIQNTA